MDPATKIWTVFVAAIVRATVFIPVTMAGATSMPPAPTRQQLARAETLTSTKGADDQEGQRLRGGSAGRHCARCDDMRRPRHRRCGRGQQLTPGPYMGLLAKAPGFVGVHWLG
jgi:hypothetical protein